MEFPQLDAAKEHHEALLAFASPGMLDSGPDLAFDALVRAVSLACGAPIARISLIGSDRQWSTANLTSPALEETPRDLAFCAHVIAGDGVFEIADASVDPRFADNPLVTGDSHIRFYAGVPLRLRNGSAIGTLSVVDHRSRQLDDTQREILQSLATTGSILWELCTSQHNLQEAPLDNGSGRSTRLQAEHAFAQERQRQADVLAATGVGTWEWHVPTDTLHFSEPWATIMGYRPEQLVGATAEFLRNALHPENATWLETEMRKYLRNLSEYHDSELRVRHSGGHFVWVQCRAALVSRTEAGEPEWVFGTWKDISIRKQPEEALRASEEFLEQTGRLAEVGGWSLEVETGLVTWTAETYRIHGLPIGTALNVNSAIEFYAPEARAAVRAVIDAALGGGTSWDLELPLIRADGQRIWVRAIGTVTFREGRPVRLIGAFQNISQRVEREHALHVAHERFAVATDSGQIGVWDWNILNNELVWDAWTYRLHGLKPRAGVVDYALWRGYVHPDDIAGAEQELHEAVEGTKPFDTHYRIVWEDGSVRHIHSSARVTRDAEGLALRMIGTSRDDTESIRLTLSARLSALGTMAGGIAHEINNPLAVISALADTLHDLAETGRATSEKILHSSSRMLHCTDRIGKIVRSLRYLARDGSRDPFDKASVPNLVSHTLDLTIERFRQNSVELRVSPIDPELWMDCREVNISQILLNLLQNAFDAAFDSAAPKWVRLEVAAREDLVTFLVIDSGKGIRPELRARIMEPFFTTKPVGKGTGLGLSLSKQMAMEHGGRLDLGEADGHTCFSLLLPRTQKSMVPCD